MSTLLKMAGDADVVVTHDQYVRRAESEVGDGSESVDGQRVAAREDRGDAGFIA